MKMIFFVGCLSCALFTFSCTPKASSAQNADVGKSENTSNFAEIPQSNVIIIKNVFFNLVDEYTVANSYMIEDYIQAFTEIFPKIIDRGPEIEFIACGLQVVSEEHELYEELGWTKVICIKIKIKDETNLPEDWNIAGETLFYYLGSGRIPGILVNTRQERLFSGFVNENIHVSTNLAFNGIDEIDEPTFTKQSPMITAKEFRNNFQGQFSKFGGRKLERWAGTELLHIEENLRLYFIYVDDDDNLHDTFLVYDDITEKLKYEDDYFHAICAMLSIFEPYLEEYQVKQMAGTITEADEWMRFWLPSGNTYNVLREKNKLSVTYKIAYIQ